jgi:predicted nucleic acid-binding protein
MASALVVAEGHGWFLRRYDYFRAVQFLAVVQGPPGLSIYEFEAYELSKAIAIVKKFADQKLTLADAHGLSIMRDRRTAACWSTDRHPALTGVRLVV